MSERETQAPPTSLDHCPSIESLVAVRETQCLSSCRSRTTGPTRRRGLLRRAQCLMQVQALWAIGDCSNAVTSTRPSQMPTAISTMKLPNGWYDVGQLAHQDGFGRVATCTIEALLPRIPHHPGLPYNVRHWQGVPSYPGRSWSCWSHRKGRRLVDLRNHHRNHGASSELAGE